MSSLLAFTSVIDTVLGAFGSIIYPAFSVLFSVMDLVQNLFKSFAGVGDSIYYDGKQIDNASFTGTGDGDEHYGLIFYLFKTSTVQTLLTSIAVLAIFLIVIFTIIAFLKNAYAEKPKTWQAIMNSAFKGIGAFVILPICCLLGVWLGNILLDTIDGATSNGGSVTLSRKLFITCAYNANRIRSDGKVTSDQAVELKYKASQILGENYGSLNFPSVSGESTDDDVVEFYADLVDTIYSSEDGPSISKYSTVDDYYRLIDINYIVLVVGGLFMIYIIGCTAFGMVKRMFRLIILYVISPFVCSYYPLDDGAMVKNWKGEFIKTTLSAYSAVAGMNLFFSIMPIIENINIGEGYTGLVGLLVQLILLIIGLYMVQDFISLIAGWIGAEDAYSQGAGQLGNIGKRLKTAGSVVNNTAKTMTGAFSRAHSYSQANKGQGAKRGFGTAAVFLGDIGKSILQGAGGLLNKNTFGVDLKKNIKDEWGTAQKEDEEFFKPNKISNSVGGSKTTRFGKTPTENDIVNDNGSIKNTSKLEKYKKDMEKAGMGNAMYKVAGEHAGLKTKEGENLTGEQVKAEYEGNKKTLDALKSTDDGSLLNNVAMARAKLNEFESRYEKKRDLPELRMAKCLMQKQ